MIPCFWYQSQNFGDALTVQLVRWITGETPMLVEKDAPGKKFIICGSILSSATETSVIWGPGVGSLSEIVHREADIRAVRGPISHWIASKSGANCPKVWGDPALLLPSFYQPMPLDRKAVGIVPHYVDQERASVMFPEAHFINVLEEPTTVIDEICSCDVILSSSLHGLIAGVAYGIPVLWLHMDDKLFGDGSKFFDFFESCGTNGEVTDVRFKTPPMDELVQMARKINVPDLQPLWKACPLPVRENLHI